MKDDVKSEFDDAQLKTPKRQDKSEEMNTTEAYIQTTDNEPALSPKSQRSLSMGRRSKHFSNGTGAAEMNRNAGHIPVLSSNEITWSN